MSLILSLAARQRCLLLGVCILLAEVSAPAQVTLSADGPGNTYELIGSQLGGDPMEDPDCSHPEFGRHVTEDFDAVLGKYVFTFWMHATPDNDRCVNFDRQRNEIKTYGPSPAYVKGFYGDTCNYRWKFKLDAGFQPSPNFCHIHQIKAGDGSDSGSPLITITPRSASPERLEIIFTAPSGLSGSGTKATANLSNFKGQWIEAFEKITYATNGTYLLTLTRMSDGAVLLAYTNNNLNMWRGDATFNRPKWGIYRSLNSPSYLRDEQVLFADFCIGKGTDICPSSIGTIPPAPTGLTAAPGNALATLAWNAAAGATSYRVKRSITNGGSYVIIAPSVTTLGYTNTGLINGTTYYYVVSAVNSTGESTNSTQVSVTPFDPGFQLTATPSTRVVNAGGGTNYTVTVTTNAPFSGVVNLGIGGLPANATANFTPTSLAATGDSTLAVQTATNTPGGNFVLTIRGTNGANVVSTTVTLTVNGLVADPGTLLWSGSAGTNWSTSANWTNITAGGFGPPGPANDLVFTNMATAGSAGVINNLADGDFTIRSLRYAETNGFHTTRINGGATLTISNNVSGNALLVTMATNDANQTITAAISGTNGTLVINNPNGNLNVRQGGAAGTHRATLDLSGLGTFSAQVGRVLIAADGGSAVGDSRLSGVLYLAHTNVITASGAAPAISIGDHPSNGRGNPAITLLPSYLFLGESNAIFADTITVGRQKAAPVSLLFNPAFVPGGPFALFRGTTGANSRVSTWSIGDNSLLTTSNQSTEGTNDFTGGTVDALIGTLYVGRGEAGAGSTSGGGATGTLTFNAGTMNVNQLEAGYQSQAGSFSAGYGTVNVNDSATLIVNNTLRLAFSSGAGSNSIGKLNLNGGTVLATNIIGGGGISTINLNSGTIDLQSSNPKGGTILNISSLNIGASNALNAALLANASTLNASNSIVIAPNGTLAGNTIITSPALVVNGAIAPGTDGAGAVTNSGAATFGAGGQYVVKVEDGGAGPAAGWSFLRVTGGLDIQATGANPFIISVQSAGGPAANFNRDTNSDWTIATAVGGIANFAANKFVVADDFFQNDLAGGYFLVRTNSGSLVLSFTNNHAPFATPVAYNKTGGTLSIPVSALASHWSDSDGDAVELADVSTNSANGINNVSTDGAFIYYTNAGSGPDTITYTIRDIRETAPAVYRDGDTVRTAVGMIQILPSLAPPGIGSIRFAGGNFVLSGTNGATNGAFFVLTTTNLTLPFSNWSLIATGAFDNFGNFNWTNPVSIGTPQRFYLLQLP